MARRSQRRRPSGRLLAAPLAGAALGVVLAATGCNEVKDGPAAPTLGPGFLRLERPAAPRVHWREGDEEQEPGPTHGLFCDLDGDGDDELVVSGAWGGDGSEPTRVIYERAGGTLEPWAEEDDPLPPGKLLACADLDRDGVVDVLLGFPFGENVPATGAARGSEYAPAFWGIGPGSFEAGPLGDEGDTELPFDSQASLAFVDVDRDGWSDLLVGERCSIAVLLRTGPRSWARHDEVLGGQSVAAEYAVGAFPLDGERQVLVGLGGLGSCDGQLASFLGETGVDEDGLPTFVPESLAPADATFRTRTSTPGAPLAFWSPMAFAAGDVDQDGALDLFLALDPWHVLLAGDGSGGLSDRSEESGLFEQEGSAGPSMKPWATALVDLDQDGRPDIVSTHGDDTSSWLGGGGGAIGPQQVTASWNAGDLSFVRFGPVAGVGSAGLGEEGNWRALSVADPDRDGDADLVVGGLGQMPEVYENRSEPGEEAARHGLSVALKGTLDTAFGIGARLEVYPEGAGAPVHLSMGTRGGPQVLERPLVFAGLGSASRAERIVVRWPSGLVDEHLDLEAGEHHQLEQSPWAFEPASRSAPADGASTVVLATSLDAELSAALASGEGSVLVEGQPGDWVITTTAPSATGSAVLELRVDGAPLAVRPRLHWTFDTGPVGGGQP